MPADAAALYRPNINRFYAYRLLSSFQLWVPIWVLYLQRDRGLSLSQILLMEAAFQIITILSEMPTGAVADRWGRKVSLLLGATAYTVAIFLFGIGESYPVLMASYLAWGLSTSLISGADAALIYDTLSELGEEASFTRVMGRAHACMTAGFLAGALVGAPLAAATTLSLPVVLSAAIAGLAACLLFTLREPPRRQTSDRLSYLQTLGEAVRIIRNTPAISRIMAVSAVLVAGSMCGIILLQPFLASHEVSVAYFGYISVPLRIAGITGSLVAHRLTRRLGERGAIYLFVAGLAVAHLIAGAVASVFATVAFMLFYFSYGAFMPVTQDIVSRQAPRELRATVVSVVAMASGLTMAVMELIVGYTADHVALRAAYLLMACFVAVAGAAALFAWTRATRPATTVPAPSPRSSHA